LSLPLSVAAVELANPGSPGKIAVKMGRERETAYAVNSAKHMV